MTDSGSCASQHTSSKGRPCDRRSAIMRRMDIMAAVVHTGHGEGGREGGRVGVCVRGGGGKSWRTCHETFG
jgi:hypothetical protein